MTGTSLPPGFRFHPTDVELVMFYLKRKVMGKRFRCEAISEINIYKFSPWDLPDKCCLKSKDREWYFFCPRERKYASGARMNRSTENGYWKTTGKDRPVFYKEKSVGMIKTLIFHQGHAPHGERTDWVIHEYKIQDEQLADAGIAQDSYVLCKLFHKNGRGPKNGAQYGAPFKEEEWDDDEMDFLDTLPLAAAPSTLRLREDPSSSVVTSMGGPESRPVCLAEPGPSSVVPPVNVVLPNVPEDDISKMLAMFTEDDALPSHHINNNVKFANGNHEINIGSLPCTDGNDIYNGLGDLGSWNMLGDCGFRFPPIQESDYMLNPMAFGDSYLELNDLNEPLNSSAAEINECLTASNPCTNYNSCGVPGQLYCGIDHYGGNQYSSGLTQLPSFAYGFDSVGDVSRVPQVNNVDGTYATQQYNAAYSLASIQSNENIEIDQNNDVWIP